ncbi:MAG: UDP-N-acetylmuramate dehydrogenase [Spirosomataceae bacterium]
MVEIQKNVSLQPFNTFGIAANARYFVEVQHLDQLQEVLTLPAYQAERLLLLGGGSNVLFLQDVEGLVLKMAIKGIEKVKEDEHSVWLKVGAGEVWHEFVLYCIEHHYAGVENLSLIPGTVGAAPMQNIGAYGVEIKEVFEELTALRLSDHQLVTFDLPTCRFGYRESIFKHEAKGQYVIVDVTFRLSKTPTFHTNYGDIQKTLADRGVTELSIKAVSEAVIQIRQSKLPNPAEIGNAGSFFKNPEILTQQYEQLKAQYPTMPGYVTSATTTKVPAGWLIEQAGWKGYRTGAVGVHARQALVLVNYGGGTGSDIKALSEQIQASVAEKFGISLHAEVNFIG